MANTCASKRFSSAMERTSEWVISQETEVPSDLEISIGENVFPLHKLIMMAKSGYIRNKIIESDGTVMTQINLSDIPGGSEAFEKAVKFCYGTNFEITVYNVAAILCAAEYLEMTDRVCGGNLCTRIGEFLKQAALKTLPGAVVVLKSCEGLDSFAEKIGLVQRCVEAVALKACNEANFPTRSPADWWLSELTSLPASFLQKVLLSMKTRGAATKTLSTIITTYAEIMLPDFLQPINSALPLSDIQPVIRKHQVAVLESIISLIKSTSVSLPVSFLCLLLRTANKLNCTNESRKEVEKWIGSDLEQASVEDLLGIALDISGEQAMDLDTIRRVIGSFVEKEGGGLYEGGSVACSSLAMQKVTKVVDAFIGEIATEGELSVSKFAGVAAAVPKSARRFDDDIYRAVDIYLKAHSELDEIEREKVCSVMDPLRLSYEARLHASQNKRLPVQVVLHALYYDQLKLRSGQLDNNPPPSPLTAAVSTRKKAGTDISLMRENEELRSELLKMKQHLSDVEKSTKRVGKRPNFFASVSKTLGKLNPFKQGSKDTLTITDEVKVDVTKPRRRRFSIS